MYSVFKYCDKKERILLNDYKQQIKFKYKKYLQLNNLLHNYEGDSLLKLKKYSNNLLKQRDYLKDDLYGLQIERILEHFTYNKQYIKPNNNLDNDVLSIVKEYHFGGTKYLFYKQFNEPQYDIATNIEEVTTLMMEGWIEKIYIGNYNKLLYIKDLEEHCELVFDKHNMIFTPINIKDIRITKNRPIIYHITSTVLINNKKTYNNYIIRDMDDYYNFEDHIIHNDLDLQSISVSSIDDVSEGFINCKFCMSIEKNNKTFGRGLSVGKSLFNSLYENAYKLINNE